jgi:hypothetical protein
MYPNLHNGKLGRSAKDADSKRGASGQVVEFPCNLARGGITALAPASPCASGVDALFCQLPESSRLAVGLIERGCGTMSEQNPSLFALNLKRSSQL